MPKQLHVSFGKEPCLTICRHGFDEDRLVYVALANKRFRYERGKSRIVYIGTTKNGIERIATSAAWKGCKLLRLHGVDQLEFHIVTCTPVCGARTWKKLERALIIRFRERFGEPPRGNKAGRWMDWDGEKEWFYEDKLDGVIDGLD